MITLPGVDVRVRLDVAEKPLVIHAGEIEVVLDPEPNSTDRLVVYASSQISRDSMLDSGGLGVVPMGEIRALEAAISEALSLIAIATGTPHSVGSFEPEFGFFDLSDEDSEFLARVGELRLDCDWMVVRAEGASRSLINLRELASVPLGDRADGVRLLAEAIASDHPTGKFRELCRLFERAFGLGPHALVEPLSGYLRAYRALDFNEREIAGWLDHLRHLATHADRREQFAVAGDVMPVLPRMLFAAHDVLFNKSAWRDASIDRRTGWTPSVAPRPDGVAFLRGVDISMGWQILDRFGVYPLRLGGEKTTVRFPSDWIPGNSGNRPIQNADLLGTSAWFEPPPAT